MHTKPRGAFFIPALIGITILILPLFLFTNAQLNLGAVNGGSVTDPVSILLAAPTAVRQCYSFSGQLNNADHPTWGAVNEPLLRPEGNSYPDNEWSKAFNSERKLPHPRVISNAFGHETCSSASQNSETCYNDWLWLWGQYMDHDLTHVPTFPRPSNATTTMTVQSPANDPFLAGRSMPHIRSFVDINSPENHNEQINLATSYLDSSQIYGSTIEKGDSIRTFRNGQLKSTFDGFMPILSFRLGLDHTSVPTFEELGSPVNKDQFLCADMRCNQHGPMASLQTMFIREHNRIALALAQSGHPAYNNDEVIYQTARACVIAINQAITYNEFLPLVLGKFNLPPYSGYNPQTRATVSNAFATAGFRTLHSMVGCDFKEMTSSGQTLRNVNFASSFFDSTWVRNLPAQPNRQNREQNAFQTIMNALGQNPSSHMDHKIAPVLRSVLFNGVTLAGGQRKPDVAFDVLVSDIQRGRDHGLLSYRKMRQASGWKDIQRFEDITLQTERVNLLRSIYGDTGVDDLDLIIGLLAEDRLDGGLLGPVTTSIIQDQFKRTRDGDRCWYENQFQGQLLNIFRSTKLKHLVDRNFNAQSNPFASEVAVGTIPIRQPVAFPPPSSATAASIVSTSGSSPTRSRPVSTSPIAISAQEIDIPLGTTTTTTATTLFIPSAQVFNPVVFSSSTPVSPRRDYDHEHHHDHEDEDKESEKRQHGRQYVVDGEKDAQLRDEDPEAYALKRKQDGRSHLDNGRGVRRAHQFDDVVGWECDKEGCQSVAMEHDPVLADDPNVLEFLRQYREWKKQQQRADPTMAIEPSPFSFTTAHPATTLNRFQAPHAFTTMQTSNNRPVSPPTGDMTELVRLTNGRFSLSPSPNILQTDVRTRLAAQVSSTVLSQNIFVTPTCRL